MRWLQLEFFSSILDVSRPVQHPVVFPFDFCLDLLELPVRLIVLWLVVNPPVFPGQKLKELEKEQLSKKRFSFSSLTPSNRY